MRDREVPTRAWAVLALAIATISSAGVLVSAMPAVDARVVAWWRMVGSAVVLAPFLGSMKWRGAWRVVLAGLFLATHFATWFASLRYIPVMRSTMLVTLAPIWAGLIEMGVLGRPPARKFWLGLGIALVGVVLMTQGFASPASWRGDLLALVGGMSGAAYFVIGSEVRKSVGVMPYMAVVCAVAALALSPVVWLAHEPVFGFDARVWWLLAALVLGPQLVGHQGLTYVLKYLPASTVTAMTLLEPLGAAVLAFIFLQEIPSLTEIAGGALVLFGVFQAWRPKS